MNVDALLGRLQRVRSYGPGRWLTSCFGPLHEHGDRNPSLSVRDVGDKLLLKCFAGCGAADIVSALGLQLSDLFEKPLDHHVRPSHSRIPPRDLLELISEETSVVAIIAADFLGNKAIDEPTWERLAKAAQRISRARDHAHGR